MQTLILTGEKDDWTPADRCVSFKSTVEKRDLLKLIIYDGAYHGFDRPKRTRTYLGHHLEYDPFAARKAIKETKAFFEHHLKKK